MIEIVTFRLREGADPDAFKALDERLQTEFFYRQPGMERRTTAVAADGTYVSITHWDGPQSADAAAAKTLGSNDFTPELTRLLDPRTIETRRYDTL